MAGHNRSTARHRLAAATARKGLRRDAWGLQRAADDPNFVRIAQDAMGGGERAGEVLNAKVQAPREIHTACDFEVFVRADERELLEVHATVRDLETRRGPVEVRFHLRLVSASNIGSRTQLESAEKDSASANQTLAFERSGKSFPANTVRLQFQFAGGHTRETPRVARGRDGSSQFAEIHAAQLALE
jgi:hypothetical protein